MKIAALILAYHRADLLQALVRRLDRPLWSAYVHLDGKSDLAPFSAIGRPAVFLEDRTDVFWGDASFVVASLDLLRRALQDAENTHFYLLSGQCYPIKSDADISKEIVRSRHGGNFINMVKMRCPTNHSLG